MGPEGGRDCGREGSALGRNHSRVGGPQILRCLENEEGRKGKKSKLKIGEKSGLKRNGKK